MHRIAQKGCNFRTLHARLLRNLANGALLGTLARLDMPFRQIPTVVAANHHHLATGISDDASGGEYALESGRPQKEFGIDTVAAVADAIDEGVVFPEKFYYIRRRKRSVGGSPDMGRDAVERRRVVLRFRNEMERLVAEIYGFVQRVHSMMKF